MKFLPIPFLLIAFIFGIISVINVWSEFSISTKQLYLPPSSTISTNTDDLAKIEVIKETLNIDSSEQDLPFLNFKIDSKNNILSYSVIGVPEIAMLQETIQNEKDILINRIQDLLDIIERTSKYNKILQNRIVELSAPRPIVDYSVIIAFIGLFISVLALLPSWIQLFRQKKANGIININENRFK